MSHSVSSEIVMYFGPSSQKPISQQIFLVIMQIYVFYFRKVGGLIQNLNRFLLIGWVGPVRGLVCWRVER